MILVKMHILCFIIYFLKSIIQVFLSNASHSNYKTRKPWLTNGMKCSLKHKNKLYAHYKKYPSQSNKKLYEEYRNMLTRLLRRTERTYYDKLLIDDTNNMKKTWSIVKDVINKKC